MDKDIAAEIYNGFFELFLSLKKGLKNHHQAIDYDGLTRMRFGALGILSQMGSLPISELARYLRITKSQATSLVDGLVSGGNAERKASKKDRRIIEVSISDAGRTLVLGALTEIHAGIAVDLAKLDEGEIEELRASLQALIALLHKIEAPAAQ